MVLRVRRGVDPVFLPRTARALANSRGGNGRSCVGTDCWIECVGGSGEIEDGGWWTGRYGPGWAGLGWTSWAGGAPKRRVGAVVAQRRRAESGRVCVEGGDDGDSTVDEWLLHRAEAAERKRGDGGNGMVEERRMEEQQIATFPS